MMTITKYLQAFLVILICAGLFAQERPKDDKADLEKHGVHAPIPIDTPDPEYTKEARKAHIEGTVVVTAVVDTTGHVTRAEVLKGLGYGLDGNALKAVRKWRFNPATREGKPVTVLINIELPFHYWP